MTSVPERPNRDEASYRIGYIPIPPTTRRESSAERQRAEREALRAAYALLARLGREAIAAEKAAAEKAAAEQSAAEQSTAQQPTPPVEGER